MVTGKPETFALETYAKRSLNYFNEMVDENGIPYFNVFWTDPAEAAHDWPDFGDVIPRQLQAVIMTRHMTGESSPLEDLWLKKILSLLDKKSGLLYRPQTSYSKNIVDIGDQALTLYALVTAYLDKRNEFLQKAIFRMVDTLLEKHERNEVYAGGFIVKSLMICTRFMNYEPALRLSEILVKNIFGDKPLFTPNNTFLQGGHVHTNLRALVGAVDYALFIGDPVIYSRADALYHYIKSVSTRFGFLPEVIGRKADIIACETCAIMDYLGLAITLANHGHPEYWGDVERIARNHLVEGQVKNTSWLRSDPKRKDTSQFTYRDIGERMLGGYAGWSSPNHILACKETLNAQWGGPELRNKTRAFQNCCGGSGTHALFIVWKNASHFENGCLSVNLHLDKLLPQAEIRCYQPFEGILTVRLREVCEVRVRIPDFVDPTQIKVESNKGNEKLNMWGNYIELGERQVGEALKITYPIPIFNEEVSIGNPGFRHYRYRVTWKGDTVVKIKPLGKNYKTGYSDFDKKRVPIFYGVDGPGPLYLRSSFLEDVKPVLSSIHMDDGSLDLWHIRKSN